MYEYIIQLENVLDKMTNNFTFAIDRQLYYTDNFELLEKCNKGKCHLEKELKKADEQQQKQLPPSLKEKSEVLYFQSFPKNSLLNVQFKSSKEKLICFYHVSYSSSYIGEIFKPPKLI